MRVIVTGGSGLIGRALLEVLAPRDGLRDDLRHDEVIVLSRDPVRAASQFARQPHVRVVGWDGRSADGWGHLVSRDCALVNLAGASPAHWRWTPRHKARIRESRLRAIAAVAQAITHYGPPGVLVQASASGYYGDRGDELLDESSPPGTGFRAAVCQEIEATVAALSVPRCCVLRTGIVLGTHAGALPPLLRFARLGGRQLGSGRQWMPWVHRTDVARAIQFLIEREACSGPYNVSAPTAATNRELLLAARRVLRRPGIFSLPVEALRALLGEMASVVLDSERMTPQRLPASGFDFVYPDLDAALRHLLRERR